MEYYSIKNLEKYQPHYKDGRRIIWIRWDIMGARDYKISKLKDHEKWLFLSLICLAVQHKNMIPADEKWIAQEANCSNNHIHKSLLMLQTLELIVKVCNELPKSMLPTIQTDNTDNTIQTDIMSGKPDLDEPIVYLNEKAKTKYDPKNKANRELVKARFSEGRTLDQFKAVIDKKVAEWLTDEKMHKYLRPSTLFSRTHFEEYLNEPEPKKKSLIEQYEVKK